MTANPRATLPVLLAGFAACLCSVTVLAATPVMIKYPGSNKCLEVAGGSPADQAVVQLAECHGGPNQRFEQVPAAGGNMLMNVNSGKCLDVARADSNDNATVWQYTCQGAPNQVFSGNELRATHSSKCVNVTPAAPQDGARAVQSDKCIAWTLVP